MNYHRWDKLTDFMRVVFLLPVIILTLAVVGSLFYYDHDVMEFSPVVGVFLAIAAIGAAGYFGILYRHSKNSQKMEALIAELPPESIPMIHPHSKERHDLFHKQQRAEYLAQFENASVATSEATYETWECAACGTKNSTKYAQCKKCGKFKGA